MKQETNDERPRFLTDEDFNLDIAQGLRRRLPLLSLLTAPEAGFLHLPDPQVLAEAQHLDRILLTHDSHTMPSHFYSFLTHLQPGEHHPGVFLIPQETAIGLAIDWLAEIWEASRHDEWRDGFVWLPL